MLKFIAAEAPPSYYFPDPNTKHRHVGRTKRELMARIVKYREQNRLDSIISLDLVIDNYLCSRPENVGKCVPVALRRGWQQYTKGAVTLLHNYFLGEAGLTTQRIADERSTICASCPENITSNTSWIDEVAELITGGRKASQHDKIGICGICTCNLRAKVWMRDPPAFTKKENILAPNACWLKK